MLHAWNKVTWRLSWSSTVAFSSFIRSSTERQTAVNFIFETTPASFCSTIHRLMQKQKQLVASEENPNFFLCFTVASPVVFITRGFRVITNDRQIIFSPLSFRSCGWWREGLQTPYASTKAEIVSAGNSLLIQSLHWAKMGFKLSKTRFFPHDQCDCFAITSTKCCEIIWLEGVWKNIDVNFIKDVLFSQTYDDGFQ